MNIAKLYNVRISITSKKNELNFGKKRNAKSNKRNMRRNDHILLSQHFSNHFQAINVSFLPL